MIATDRVGHRQRGMVQGQIGMIGQIGAQHGDDIGVVVALEHAHSAEFAGRRLQGKAGMGAADIGGDDKLRT
mgnify:CR=1 FL=1